jgi:DNA-binding MarR family transcriptional regulator
MTRGDDLLRLVLAAHAVTRLAALETGNEAPSAQWRTLKLLRDHGPQRIGDLAHLSRVTQPGMTRLVGQLAEAGLVTRESDPSDARALVVAPTPHGDETLDAWLVQLREALEPYFADLDATGWAAVAAAADALTAATAATAASETVR